MKIRSIFKLCIEFRKKVTYYFTIFAVKTIIIEFSNISYIYEQIQGRKKIKCETWGFQAPPS